VSFTGAIAIEQRASRVFWCFLCSQFKLCVFNCLKKMGCVSGKSSAGRDYPDAPPPPGSLLQIDIFSKEELAAEVQKEAAHIPQAFADELNRVNAAYQAAKARGEHYTLYNDVLTDKVTAVIKNNVDEATLRALIIDATAKQICAGRFTLDAMKRIWKTFEPKIDAQKPVGFQGTPELSGDALWQTIKNSIQAEIQEQVGKQIVVATQRFLQS